MNSVYANFAQNYMAIPVVKGLKSESERFAGAEQTYCIEALMQDGKALQAGTSHFLGQNFAKAFDVKFTNKEGKLNYVLARSCGYSTRLMGALIMTQSDDKGLVLPPKLSPYQVVIVPIFKTDSEFDKISDLANKITRDLQEKNISVKFDNRTTHRPGAKFAQHELQGVPLRLAIGPKDLENKTVELSRRDDFSKSIIPIDLIEEKIPTVLEDIQQSLFLRANKFRLENTTKVDSFDEFKEVLKNKGGFILAHWDGSAETENKIKQLTKATIRCIPLDSEKAKGKCVFSGKDSDQRVLFAKAY